MPFQIFSGIYQTFQDIPEQDEPFESDRWLTSAKGRLEKACQEGSVCEEYGLPLLAATSVEKGAVCILDFGGGVGTLFPLVRDVLPQETELDYHVIDNPPSCQAGREAHGEESGIHFHETLPKQMDTVHIVHLGSVLQYVDDWKGLLKQLVAYQPRHLLFSDSMVGAMPTFITVQDYYGKKIPFRFINQDELSQFMQVELGYSLCYRSKYLQTVQGVKSFYDMDNLPAAFRVDCSYHLLYSKSTS
ncbi:MAG: methyltransferase, TIGR04325 family [Magnetococcales bacterium]|nr:methyltransferase, TIGR04325 family [Magnetococcales bacterium]